MLAASGAVVLMEPNVIQAALDNDDGDEEGIEVARATYGHFARAARPDAPIFVNLWLLSEASAARALRAFPRVESSRVCVWLRPLESETFS